MLVLTYVNRRYWEPMGAKRQVSLDDLVDSTAVAELLGLGNRRAVSVYQTRYPDMPRPVIVSDAGRCQLWLRSEVEGWARASGRLGPP